MEDITVDTNVLMHSDMPDEPHFESSLEFLEKLVTSNVLLCIDDDFDPTSNSTSSLIGYEYQKHLVFGTLGYEVLVELAKNGRVYVVGRKVKPNIVKICNMLVPNNKRDRTFIRVALNSVDKHFVSHDFTDFSIVTRQKIQKQLCVSVVDAPRASVLIPTGMKKNGVRD